jgi:hypothetical protein
MDKHINDIKKVFAQKNLLCIYLKNQSTLKVILSESLREEALEQSLGEALSEIKGQLKSRKLALKTLTKSRTKICVTSEEMNPYELFVMLNQGLLKGAVVPSEKGLVIDLKTFKQPLEDRVEDLLEEKESAFKEAMSSLMRKGLIATNTPMKKESGVGKGAEVYYLSI